MMDFAGLLLDVMLGFVDVVCDCRISGGLVTGAVFWYTL